MKNELLALNPKALQFLHHANGFDFCKPYEIHRIDGRFTLRTVKALIPEGHTAAALLVPDPNGVRWSRLHTLYYIRINADGFDPIDNHKNVPYDARHAYVNDKYHDINDFYSKGDFEEIRKHGTKHLYIVTQSTEIITQTGRGRIIDFTERFAVEDYSPSSSYLLIRLFGHNGEWIHYQSGCWFGSRRPTKTADLIDKSGYILDRRRADLLSRAAKLKAERQKAAAAVADYTERYNELVAALKLNREQLAAAILDPEGYENMRQYAYRCYDLGHAQDYLDSYVRKTAAKSWKSCKEIEWYLKRADEYINKEV